MMKRLIVFLYLTLFTLSTYAQCAMCRATLVNNVSAGDTSLAAKLNIGILYLFFIPYILIGAVAFFWYKQSKANAKKITLASHFKGKMS